MQLTEQDLAEFKQAYTDAFGEVTSDAEAREMASRVLWLYELLLEPLPTKTTRPLDENPASGVRS